MTNEPQKEGWFIKYLDEKFEQLELLIKKNEVVAKEEHKDLHERIDKVVSAHRSDFWLLIKIFAVTLVFCSFIFIKESRDLIIKILF